jgi:hypothetical protein
MLMMPTQSPVVTTENDKATLYLGDDTLWWEEASNTSWLWVLGLWHHVLEDTRSHRMRTAVYLMYLILLWY